MLVAQVIVGVNKYRLEKEVAVDVLSIDNTTVRKKQVSSDAFCCSSRPHQLSSSLRSRLPSSSWWWCWQVERLQHVKATRDEAKVQAALAKLTESAGLTGESTSKGSHPLNLLKLAVDAARARASLGEISGASVRPSVSQSCRQAGRQA